MGSFPCPVKGKMEKMNMVRKPLKILSSLRLKKKKFLCKLILTEEKLKLLQL
jgi:hypothetical protein